MTGSSIDAFVKVARARDKSGEGERWSREEVAPTCNAFDAGDARTTVAIIHGADLKQFGGTFAEVIPTITATHYKDAPCVFSEER